MQAKSQLTHLKQTELPRANRRDFQTFGYEQSRIRITPAWLLMKSIVLSHFQARQLLQAKAGGAESCTVLLDLNRPPTVVPHKPDRLGCRVFTRVRI